MRIGRLSNRVTLARREDKKDDYGEMVRNIIDYGEVWADIGEEKRVSEQDEEGILQYFGEYTVTIRYNTKVKNGDYMTIEGQHHRISNVYHDFKHRRYTKFNAVFVEDIN
ncbi:phage head closure protein [Vibrio mytili]|uniref:phage head closure protein n=1 Tax=Vibrio mytili TaxID=50718 RepID=UPI002F3FBE88